ncbi:MAG: aspartyl protease family protein [Candidatus Tumulicola sp.]
MRLRRLSLILGFLYLAFAFCVGTATALAAGKDDAALDVPPSGLAPPTAKLADVLAAHDKAIGAPTAGAKNTVVEEWTFSDSGMAGTERLERADLNYHSRITEGPFVDRYGQYQGTRWHQDANGFTTETSQIDARSFYAVRVLEDAADPKNDVTMLGDSTGAHPAWVLQIKRSGYRHPEWIFYDKVTAQVVRVEFVGSRHRIVETYDDFRTTQGLTEPWRIHSSDGFSTNDDDETLQSLAIGGPVDAADLAVPARGTPLLKLDAPSVTVPVTIAGDRIVIPVRMGGHTVDFIVDSGADGIVIDTDVVEALNIKQYGRTTNETAGTYVESAVVLPKMMIGALTLENVHAISLPFVAWTDAGTPIAGLLGFDFIADVVWHVDYLHGTMEALNPAGFIPPKNARAFAVTFDDRVPTLGASIAGINATALVVDTGADRSTLFSAFAQAHVGRISDQGLGTAMQAAFPFVDDFYGVGGKVDFRPVQAGPFVFGPWTFPKWLFYVTQNAPSFEIEDYDGLIGQDFLRNFDLYLDYPHSKIYLAPNDRFRQRWPS